MWFEMLRIVREVGSEWVFVENSDRLIGRGICTVERGLQAAGYACEVGLLSAGACGANHERMRCWIVGRKVADVVRDGAGKADGQAGGPEVGKGRGERVESGNDADLAADSNGYECPRERVYSGRWGEGEGEVVANGVDEVADVDEKRRGERPGEGCVCGGRGEFAVGDAADSNSVDGDGCGYGAGWVSQRGPAAVSFRRWPVEPDVVRVVHGFPFGMDRVATLGNAQVPRVAAAAFSLLARKLGWKGGL